MQLVLDILAASANIALGGLALVLVMRSSKALHFAHAGILLLAPYMALSAHRDIGLPLSVALPFGVAVSAGLGWLIEERIYRVLRERLAHSLVLFVASLGIYVVIQNSIALAFGSQVQSIRPWEITEGWHICGGVLTPLQVAAIGCSFAAGVGIYVVQHFSRFGVYMRALWCDPKLATSMGVPVRRVRSLAVLLGSALAGVSGILLALDIDMTPSMGLNPLLLALVAVVVGRNRPLGIVAGALLIAAALNIGVLWLPIRWQSLIVFVILLAFILIAPRPRAIAASQAG